MGDVLSQSEVESLLAALDASTPVEIQEPAAAARRDDAAAQISIYDFKRPERVSKEQMRAFHALHEGFGREFGATLSGMLRAIVEVKLISVDQLTYSEFVFSLENPTCFNLLWSEGLGGHLILDLNLSIIFPILDRLLGGGKQGIHQYPRRPLTEIELQLIARITSKAIKGLQAAWANIFELKLEVSQVESNPQLIQIVPPNEVIVLISFEIMMGEIRGIMNLCIPFNTIEPLAGKLSSDSWSSYTKKAAEPRQRINLEVGVNRSTVAVIANLAKAGITTRELNELAVGDVIMTETSKLAGAEILVEGRRMFTASAGAVNGRRAIMVSEQVVKPRDLVDQRLATAENASKSLSP